MKVFILYHPDSEHARMVEEFVKSYRSLIGKNVQLMSLEEREGAYYAKTYDVVQYPAILVIQDDGQVNKRFEGLPLPLINDMMTV